MSRRRGKALQAHLVCWSAWLWLSAGPLPAQQTVVAADLCQRVHLPSLESVFAPVWVDSRSQILVSHQDTLSPSPKAQQVVALLASGGSAGRLYPKLRPLGFSRVGDDFLQFDTTTIRVPDEIAKEVPGIAKEVPGIKATWYDRYLNQRGSTVLWDPSGSGIHILDVHNWTVVSDDETGDYLVALGGYSGDLVNGHQGVGVFYHRLYPPESGMHGRSILAIPMDLGATYYRGNEQYFAAIGSVAYFLNLREGSPPELFRLSPSEGTPASPLAGFPGEPLPFLADEPGSTEEYGRARQDLLNQSEHVRGLYSDGELLYALSGGSRHGWRLAQFAPGPDSVTLHGTMRIPSTANNLTLLPAGDQWFVFEQFERGGETRVPTMLVIPRAKVKNSFESALYGAGAKWIRCAER